VIIHKDETKTIDLDMYENIVIIENGSVVGVINKKSLTNLISILGVNKILELCDCIKPDVVVQTRIDTKRK
jgi:hypothetical protein